LSELRWLLLQRFKKPSTVDYRTRSVLWPYAMGLVLMSISSGSISSGSLLSGKCMCGAVSWSSTKPMVYTAICHCRDCRKAASSDYVSWFGVGTNGLTWKGPRKHYKSSPLVTRSFCEICGSPLSFKTEVIKEQTHLYAATLDDVSLYKPTAHLYWSERLAWVSFADNLPKHRKGLQHAVMNDENLWG
jgi:hypothetical protein